MNSPEAQAIRKEFDPQIAKLKKEVKKKKGAYKKKAEEELEALQTAFAEALAPFKNDTGSSDTKSKGKTKKKAAEPEKPMELDYHKSELNGMTNKELKDCCAQYGLSKKGNKESLIGRLMDLALDVESRQAEKAAAGGGEEDKKDDDEDDEPEMTEEEKKAAEKLFKCQRAMQRALSVMIKKNPDGVDVDNVMTVLEGYGVKNFNTKLVGCETVDAMLQHEFLEGIVSYQKADGDTPARVVAYEDSDDESD